MSRVVAGKHKPQKRIPIMTALAGLFAVNAQFQGQFPVKAAEVGDEAGIQKQDGIPIRFEIRPTEPVLVELVLIGIKHGRIVAGLDEIREDGDGVGVKHVV